jgi:hypothetical protein
VTSIVVLSALAGWACWPLGSTEVAIPPEPIPGRIDQPPDARSLAALDLAVFGAPIWDPPPPPPPAPKPEVVAAAPPPPPLKLQLLGIVQEDDGHGNIRYVAAIYDETTDKLLMLKDGEPVGSSAKGHRVTRVTVDGVELTDSSGPRRLALREPLKPIAGLKLLTDASANPDKPAKPGRKQ